MTHRQARLPSGRDRPRDGGRNHLAASHLHWLVWLALAAVPAFGQGAANSPVAVLPRLTATGTDGFFSLDLRNGAVTYFDRLRRDPLRARLERVAQNLFQDIGRPLDQPAAANEIFLAPLLDAGGNARSALFVETSTGYVAYFEQLGKGSTFGKITTVVARPFGPLASPDGNFALLMRRGTSGRSEGAYLYHASSGRTLLLDGLAKLEIDPPVRNVPALPRLSGQVCAVDLQSSSETTIAYLVADAADGSLHFLDLDPDDFTRVTVRESPASLFDAFEPQGRNPTPRRFAAVPIQGAGDDTEHVFFVDAASGEMALFENATGAAARPALRKLALNAYGALRTDVTSRQRIVALVPAVAGSGETRGVWLVDSLTRAMAYVENPGTPGSASIRRVAVEN